MCYLGSTWNASSWDLTSMLLGSPGCMERPYIGVLADSQQPALIARLMSEEVFRELYPQSPPHCNYVTDCECRTAQLTLVNP